MTITITDQQVYFGVIIFFIIMQVWQWVVITKLQKECDRLWEQMGTLVAGVSNRLIDIQKDLSTKEDKKAG
jgi:hypothetical protein